MSTGMPSAIRVALLLPAATVAAADALVLCEDDSTREPEGCSCTWGSIESLSERLASEGPLKRGPGRSP
jgi:hypothetical protein